jgi:hypothetical protein
VGVLLLRASSPAARTAAAWFESCLQRLCVWMLPAYVAGLRSTSSAFKPYMHASLLVCAFLSTPSEPTAVFVHCCFSSCCEQQQQQQQHHHKALASTPRVQWQCNSNIKSSSEWGMGQCRLLLLLTAGRHFAQDDGEWSNCKVHRALLVEVVGAPALSPCRPCIGGCHFWLVGLFGAASPAPRLVRAALPQLLFGLGAAANCADKYSGSRRIG